ncbi:MAG: hypothetical protein GY847_27125 [Proteobacteria bacterium]|nr:hypothetical protein [Pseudomonadota bacterium]
MSSLAVFCGLLLFAGHSVANEIDPPCDELAPYVAGHTYGSGDIVGHVGEQYQCKRWPYSILCGLASFEPGDAQSLWSLAWDYVRDCSQLEVMVLGDNWSETRVIELLESKGHSVTYAGLYYEWDGIEPDISAFDVVVWIEGEDYGYCLTDAADDAISAYITSGGGLVRTEWAAYDIYGEDCEDQISDNLMPTTSPEGDYEYGTTWNVIDGEHPLTEGLPATWDDTYGGISLVTANPTATVVIENSSEIPLLTFDDVNGGMVVHINNDFGSDEDEDAFTPEMQQIMHNACVFSAGY